MGTRPSPYARLSAALVVLSAASALLWACATVLGIGDVPPVAPREAGVEAGPQSGKDAPVCSELGRGLGTPGCPCSPVGAVACAARASAEPLVCGQSAGGEAGWIQSRCQAYGEACDSDPDSATHGRCIAEVPECVGSSPGAPVCTGDGSVARCGPDLITTVDASTCPDASPICTRGRCVCVPNSQRCVDGGVETCSSESAWSQPFPCVATCGGGSCNGMSSTATSCERDAGGAALCGQAEPCCGSIDVSGGTYFRSYKDLDGGTGAADSATGYASPATVSGFRLDLFEVTVGRFRAFVNAWNAGSVHLTTGMGKHAHLNGGRGLVNANAQDGMSPYEQGWQESWNAQIAPTDVALTCDGNQAAAWTSAPAGYENYPMGCVNWYEAYAFCIWDGGFLPSEAEWEYAAAGGSEQRILPWGDVIPPEAGETEYAIYGCFYPGPGPSCMGVANLAPVGTATLGFGLYGQKDLGGSLAEWVLDSYSDYTGPCVDCAFLLRTTVSLRLERGGSMSTSLTYLAPANRGTEFSTTTNPGIGFRCARTP